MDSDGGALWQLVAVVVVLIIAIIWIIRRLIKGKDIENNEPCSGCALSEACSPKKRKQHSAMKSKKCDEQVSKYDSERDNRTSV